MAGEYKKLHRSAVGGIYIRRDDIAGTPYAELMVQIGRDEISIHVNTATLMSVTTGLIEASKELQLGRGANATADHANIRAQDAKAL